MKHQPAAEALAETLSSGASFIYLRPPGSDSPALYLHTDGERKPGLTQAVVADWHSQLCYFDAWKPGLKGSTATEVPAQEYTDFTAYREAFERSSAAIAQGMLSKVVLSRIIDLAAPSLDAPALFAVLSAAYPQSLVYLLRHPSQGMWMGASPEVLLAGSNGHYRSMSLAGTRPAGSTGSWPQKEVREQEWVSTHIRRVLGPQRLREGVRFNLDVGPVQHLCTPFTCELTEEELMPMALELHPTPAVAGEPRVEALDWLSKTEAHHRRLYTGLVGLVGSHTQLFVNLRCMQIFEKKVQLYVGGGIVSGSSLANEWRETETKSLTLARYL